jgi:type II secretory pathway component PulF
VVAKLSDTVNQGQPLHEAMESCGQRFSQLDKHTIGLSERSGGLDIGLLSLSQYYDQRAAARRRIIAGLPYPMLLLAAGVFIPQLPALILGSITLPEYLWRTAGVLARLAVVGWIVSWLVRWLFTVAGLKLTMDRLLRAVPVLGRLRFDYALSQWVSSIRLMLRAGIGIVPALEDASRAVDSPLIADAYERAAPLMGGQLEVSQALASTRTFPDDLIQLWATGEQSGKMDEMLDRLAKFYEEHWRHSLDQTATWVPRIIYLLIVFNIAWQVLAMGAAYVHVYDELLR